MYLVHFEHISQRRKDGIHSQTRTQKQYLCIEEFRYEYKRKSVSGNERWY